MSIEFVLLFIGAAAIVFLCRFLERLLFRNSGKKENRGRPAEYAESEPEDLAARYRKK